MLKIKQELIKQLNLAENSLEYSKSEVVKYQEEVDYWGKEVEKIQNEINAIRHCIDQLEAFE